MNRPSVFATIENFLLNFVLLFFSFSIAVALSVVVKILPANHGLQISNAYLASGYNPEENFAKVIFVIFGSALLFLGLKKLALSYNRYFRLLCVAILAFGVFAITLMPNVESYIGNIDTFHQGEQLSPAQAYGNGKKLYSGLFVLHGAGDDIILPHLSLHLPGTNPQGGIGSYFFVQVTFEVISAILFFLVLSQLFKSTAIFLAASLWFTLSDYSLFYYIRDIFIWLTCLILIHILLRKPSHKTKMWLMAGLGFIASGTYFYAIDRGFVASFAVALTAVILVFFLPRANSWELDWHLNWKRILPAAYTLGGALLAQLIGLILLGSSEYAAFLKTTFIYIPKFDGYLFNYPIPDLGPDTYTIWLPLLVAAAGLILLYFLLKDKIKKKIRLEPSVILAIILFLTGIIFLRTGYGRPDFGHIAYSTPLLFISIFYISYLAFQKYHKVDIQYLWPVALIVLLLFWPMQTVPLERITSFADMKASHLKIYLKLPSYPDTTWLPAGVQQISNYIKQNTKPTDPIFIFTQQPIYYYLTDRPNPTRFYIPWFADPGALTSGMLSDLKKDPPKLILYTISNGAGWDMPDGYSMAQRTPDVNAWILANYPKQIHIGGALLLEK